MCFRKPDCQASAPGPLGTAIFGGQNRARAGLASRLLPAALGCRLSAAPCGPWMVAVSLFRGLQTKTISCFLKSLAQVFVCEGLPSCPAVAAPSCPYSRFQMPGERSEQVSPNPSPTVECGVSSQDKPFPGRKPGCNVSGLQVHG